MLNEFLLACVISCAIAVVLYVVSASVVSRYWNRNVTRDTKRYDIVLGLSSLLVGSPILQGFGLLSKYYGISMMYTEFDGYGWLYWAISVPLYVACWDAVFYLGHLVLHWPSVYKLSHFRHHACRPPVPWSGIAIDPIETLLSGILPYVVPLFIFPFHIYTVYALNIMLMVWATVVHSSMNFTGNMIMLSTKDHNLHHTFGRKNCNFGAVFTFWDRMGNSLNRTHSPPWWGNRDWKSSNTPRVTPEQPHTAPVAGPDLGAMQPVD